MWVTSVDNYQQDGVIFRGNVRNKDTGAAYAKMKQRLAVRLVVVVGGGLVAWLLAGLLAGRLVACGLLGVCFVIGH